MFLCLPFVIWLSLVLVGPAVTGWCLSPLCVCKLISVPLGDHFPLEQFSFGLPSSWVQVGPWETKSQVILYSSVLCVPGYNSLLSHRSVDGGRVMVVSPKATVCLVCNGLEKSCVFMAQHGLINYY